MGKGQYNRQAKRGPYKANILDKPSGTLHLLLVAAGYNTPKKIIGYRNRTSGSEISISNLNSPYDALKQLAAKGFLSIGKLPNTGTRPLIIYSVNWNIIIDQVLIPDIKRNMEIYKATRHHYLNMLNKGISALEEQIKTRESIPMLEQMFKEGENPFDTNFAYFLEGNRRLLQLHTLKFLKEKMTETERLSEEFKESFSKLMKNPAFRGWLIHSVVIYAETILNAKMTHAYKERNKGYSEKPKQKSEFENYTSNKEVNKPDFPLEAAVVPLSHLMHEIMIGTASIFLNQDVLSQAYQDYEKKKKISEKIARNESHLKKGMNKTAVSETVADVGKYLKFGVDTISAHQRIVVEALLEFHILSKKYNSFWNYSENLNKLIMNGIFMFQTLSMFEYPAVEGYWPKLNEARRNLQQINKNNKEDTK